MNDGRNEWKQRGEAQFDQGGGQGIKLTCGGFGILDEVRDFRGIRELKLGVIRV